MGANLSFRTYKTDDFQEAVGKFKEDQEDCRRENGHSYSGCIGMLDGVSKYVTSKKNIDEAIEWLKDNAEKWEEAKVVSYTEDKVNYFLIGGWCSS